jgi:MFS transporter, ACS family, solute carrier family 17 (sodium-dependent inorganic phosphate cotransporter), other
MPLDTRSADARAARAPESFRLAATPAVPSRAYGLIALLAAAVFISYIDRTNISVGALAMQSRFGWSETQKGAVLAAFYAGYLPLMIASGAIANRYGGRVVLGAAVIWWSAFTALTPAAALMSFSALLTARGALGLGEAAVFPASFNLIGTRIPVVLRSRAVALVTSSAALGTVFALFASGWMVRAYGWPAPFYCFGALGLGWAVLWWAAEHDGSMAARSMDSGPVAIPWRELLRARPVWAIVAAHFCYNWCSYVLLAWMPSYFKSAFGATVASAGMLSAAPWVAVFVTANVAGHLADRSIRRGVAVIVVRKLAQVSGLVGVGVFLIALAGAPSLISAVILMCVATGFLGLSQAGFAPNCLDVAPRHSDVVYGLSNTIATLPGLFGVLLTGWLVDRTGSFAAAFFATAAVAWAGALIYGGFAAGTSQIPAAIRPKAP